MYGRNGQIGTVDLAFLQAATLIQICLGEYDLGLVFDGPIKPASEVMLTSSFAIKVLGQQQSTHRLEEGHLLRQFLGRDVQEAKWGDSGTLILTFDDEN